MIDVQIRLLVDGSNYAKHRSKYMFSLALYNSGVARSGAR